MCCTRVLPTRRCSWRCSRQSILHRYVDVLTQFATVSISASGLEVVSEMNQTVQAHAYLYASIFDEYTFTPPENWHEFGRTQEESDEEEDTQPYICFEVNASTIVQCLGLFESRMGNATSREGLADVARRRGEYVEIVYRAVGEPLCLRMHTGRLEMGFRLRTLDSSLTPSLQFSPDDTVAQVIMKVRRMAHTVRMALARISGAGRRRRDARPGPFHAQQSCA